MRKKFLLLISVVLALVMGIACVSCAVPDLGNENANGATLTQELEILKSDIEIPEQQITSRIKAEYLKENDGYRDDDEVVAIIKLGGDSLIETFNKGNTARHSVADYAVSAVGKRQARNILGVQNALIRELSADGLIESVNYNYTTVVNAVAVTTTYGNFKKLEKYPSLESVSLADTYNRPQVGEGSDASAIVNAVDVYETGIFNSSSVDYKGKGTAVAVLDSGFDCSHSVFSNQPADSELWISRDKVASVLDETRAAGFTDGLEVTDVWYSNKIPFKYDYADKDNDVFPYDSEHGTHVAGIIGGQDTVITGVAVETQLVLLKVFPDLNDGAKTDDILAALEDAVLLNVDAINMSLGSSCGFTREEDGNVINDVYDDIDKSGISLLTAASNSYSSAFGGEQGNTNKVWNPDSSTVGSPSTYKAALSVASISGTKSKYLIGNGEQVIFFTESNSITGKPNDFFAEVYQKLRDGGEDIADGAEKTIEYITVPGVGTATNFRTVADRIKGKIALVRRGDNTFEEKARNAKNAGALACIIYNNVEGDINMSMGKSDHIPTISISKEIGTVLAERSSGTLTIKGSNEAGPFMSDFSSWGPSPNLELKPEITAHGGNIKSAIPGGEYDELSGTSMATPNLCGIVVLIRQFIKENYPELSTLSTKEVSVFANRLLMSTASIVLNEEGVPYSPRKQGAGLASLFNVVNTKAYLTVDNLDRTKIELYDDPERAGVYKMDFNLVNLSDEALEYDLSLVGMTETVSTSDKDFVAETGHILDGKYEVTASGAGRCEGGKVTVEAGKNKSVKVSLTYTLTADDRNYIDTRFPNGMFVEGFVKLAAIGEGEIDLNVPFLGFYGDWTQAPMFDKTYYEVESEAHNGGIDEEDKIKADYYATTPYGTYFYSYIIPFGTYLYDTPDGYDEIPASEEHAAMSNALATIDGISAVYSGLLRGAKEMQYTITDKLSGETLWSHIDYNANKAYSLGGAPVPSYDYLNIRTTSSELNGKLINNREYEFKMQGVLDYGEDGGLTTNARNTFDLDFTFDNEAPIIKSATYEKTYDRTLKKDRHYVTLTIYDNHYVMSVSPVAFYEDSETNKYAYSYLTDEPIPVYSNKGTDNKVRIEITDMLDDMYHDGLVTSSMIFMVDDYALNSNIYTCALPGTRGDFKFTADGSYDGRELRTLELGTNEIIDLTAYLATSDTSVDADKDYLGHLSWTSSNTKVAVVEKGQVRGIAPGTTTITATEGIDGKSARLLVRVYANGSAQVSSLENAGESIESAKQLRTNNDVADVTQATIESIKISYFDTEYAHARAGQQSEIGKTGSRTYTSSLPTSGTPAWPTVSVYPGERIRLHYDIKPWYVEDKYEITFESNNPDIAAVSKEGLITALAEGNATITVRVQGSNQLASINITVKNPFVIEDRILVAYKGLGGDVVIPDDEGISYIGPYAFCLYTTDNTIYVDEDDYDANKIPQANTTVTSITVPYGVEDIQKYAFYNCTGLESVTLPSTIRFVREYTFAGDVNLKVVNNLGEAEVIGAHAFDGCTSLESADLSKAYAIGESAFKNCSALESVDLTALRNTGRGVFEGCTQLGSVKLTANTKLSREMFARSGLVTVDVYETVEIPQFCFADCARLTTVNIHNDLVTIGSGAFSKCSLLETVNILGKVDGIGAQVFQGCENLKKITLPNCAVTLGNAIFGDCKNLEEVAFGKDTVLKSIGTLFGGTNIKKFTVAEGGIYSVSADGKLLLTDGGKTAVLAAVGATFGEYTLPSEITKIAPSAFAGTDISALIVSGNTEIGSYAFASCNKLERVVFPTGCKITIGNNAFRGNAELKEIENLESAEDVGDYAFAETGLTSASVGANSVYGEGVFFRSKLTVVTVGANAKFGLGAFQRCDALTTVHMPAAGGVHFGIACFYGDALLKDIDLSKHDAVIESQAFYGCTSLITANLAEVTEIGTYAFGECAALSAVSIPKLVKLGEGAFARYEDDGTGAAFIEITLPATLKEMGDGAFLGCSRLREIVIPSSVEKFGNIMFGFCAELSKVTLPAGITDLGILTFIGCESLDTVNTSNITVIGDSAFRGCVSLRTLSLENVVSIGAAAFAESSVYGEIDAPKLEYIGLHGFESAYNITGFDAPNLKVIEEAAFMNCYNLASFAFSDSLEKVGIMAFYCDTRGGIPRLTSFYLSDKHSTSGKINDYALLDDGSLYITLPSGKLQLQAVPSAKTSTTLTVKEGTVRIEAYAGNSNSNVRNIVLPDSLKIIGNFAFYGYDRLESVEFRSFAAPTLENWFINSRNANNYPTSLTESDPGYELLQGNFDLFEYEFLYFNFINLVGKKLPINMTVPANSNITGYDNLIYEVYFGKLSSAKRSDYEAQETNMYNFVDYAREIMAIDLITMAHERLVDRALTAYNAVKQDYSKYGYTEEEWTAMANAVQAARARIVRLKIENSNYAVRTLQAKIDALPETFAESVRAAMDEITADMAKLTVDERGILDLTKYNALYEAYNPSKTPEGPDLEKPDPGDSGCSCSLAGAASSLAASALVLMFVLSAIFLRIRARRAASEEESDKGDRN